MVSNCIHPVLYCNVFYLRVRFRNTLKKKGRAFCAYWNISLTVKSARPDYFVSKYFFYNFSLDGSFNTRSGGFDFVAVVVVNTVTGFYSYNSVVEHSN